MPELSDNGEDDLLKLLHDPDEDAQEESPMEKAKLIYAALDDKSALPDNPKTLKEAHDSPKWLEWKKAVKAEMDQLHQMGTWELVDLCQDRVSSGLTRGSRGSGYWSRGKSRHQQGLSNN